MTVKHPDPLQELMRVLSCIEDKLINNDLSEQDSYVLFRICEYYCKVMELQQLDN